MKVLYTSLCFLCSICFIQAQLSLNVDLFGQVQRADNRYSGSWSYIAPDGAEYAVLGAATGTAVYTIDDANNIAELGFIPGPTSNWREITVLAQYAYVTTEGSGPTTGMQVIDLRSLPDSISLVTTYDSTFTTGHILQRDIYSDASYVYVCGTTSTRGVHIMEVSDPENPQEVGLYNPGYYIHDCHVNGDLLFAAASGEGKIDIVDISDKTKPTFISDFDDPNGNTHSSWLTEDKKYLFVTSELDGTPARIFNVEDVNDPFAVATYSANLASLVHNPYIRGDFAFISHNTEGLRVVDIADPELPIEVGFYDTYAGASGGFSGLWSACPYFPSGKIIGGNRTDGLYIWTFNNARAGRIYGQVLDKETGKALPDAIVLIEDTQEDLTLDLEARFKFGALPGSFTFSAEAEAYESKTITIDLVAEDQKQLIIELTPLIDATREVKPANKALVQPNPCSSSCQLLLQDYPSAHSISIYDILGRKVRHLDLNLISENQGTLDVTSIGTGLFFLMLKDKKGNVVAGDRLLIPNGY